MKRPFCMFCLLFAFLVFGLLQMCPLPTYPYDTGQRLKLMGVVEQTQSTADKQIIYLSEIYLDDNQDSSSQFQKKVKLNTKVQVYLKPGRTVMPALGEKVIVQGTFMDFAHSTNPGQFDQKNYQASLGIGFALYQAEVLYRTLEQDSYGTFLRKLREKWGNVYSENLEENGGILQAMILGQKQEMDQTIKELYRRNGLAHLLSISALHISFVGMSLFQLLKKCRVPLFVNVLLSLALVFSYGKMCEGSSATMRAILMFSLFLLAKIRRRTYDLLTGIAFAFFLLILENPRILWNTGFQLSFFAVLGIGIVNPTLQEIFPAHYRKKPDSAKKRLLYWAECYIKLPILSSLGINSFLLPILLSAYYEFPVYSLFLNLLVIPLMSLVLGFGILGGLLGLGFPACAGIFLLPADKILSFYQFLCVKTQRLPGAIWIVGKPEPWQILLYYSLLLMVLFAGSAYLKKRESRVVWRTIAFVQVLIVLLLLLCLPGTIRRNYSSRITMLDIGQGDCFCIETKGKVLLVDGGSSSEKQVGKYRIEPFLKSQGISQVDYILVSHSDSDHCNGVEELLCNSQNSGITYKNLVLTEYARQQQTEYTSLLTAAQKNGSRVSYISGGMELLLEQGPEQEQTVIKCLLPKSGETYADANDSSMVLLFICQGMKILFTGDLSSAEEGNMAACDVDILKVGHHGSRFSTSDTFLNKVKPEMALISAGKNNTYGHPHKEVLDRLAQRNCNILRTDEMGAVVIELKRSIRK